MSCVGPFHRKCAFPRDHLSVLLTLSRNDDTAEPCDVSELEDHEVEKEVREKEGGVTSQDRGWREHVEAVHSWDVSSDIETGGGNGGTSHWDRLSSL